MATWKKRAIQIIFSRQRFKRGNGERKRIVINTPIYSCNNWSFQMSDSSPVARFSTHDYVWKRSDITRWKMFGALEELHIFPTFVKKDKDNGVRTRDLNHFPIFRQVPRGEEKGVTRVVHFLRTLHYRLSHYFFSKWSIYDALHPTLMSIHSHKSTKICNSQISQLFHDFFTTITYWIPDEVHKVRTLFIGEKNT